MKDFCASVTLNIAHPAFDFALPWNSILLNLSDQFRPFLPFVLKVLSNEEEDGSENEVAETKDMEDSDEEVLANNHRRYSPLHTQSGKEVAPSAKLK